MNLFHVIEEGTAILCSRGVYRQAKLFRNGKDLYAGFGSGYVKLYNGKGTSHPRVSWIEFEGEGTGFDTCKQPKWVGLPEVVIKKKGKK